MDSLIRKIEDVYESITIAKAFVICECEEVAKCITAKLDEQNHSVMFITEDDIVDERPLYASKINTYDEYCRVLIMSYSTWYRLKDVVETRVLPTQNLVILVNLEDGVISYVSRYLADASMRGFSMGSNSHLVVMNEEIICE